MMKNANQDADKTKQKRKKRKLYNPNVDVVASGKPGFAGIGVVP